MFKPNAAFLIDFYKAGHRQQYPEGTEFVYSNFTPRSDRLSATKTGYVMNVGVQMAIHKIHDLFQENFFGRDKDDVISEYKTLMQNSLVVADFDTSHIEALHDLGYLPVKIKSLPEGRLVPIKVPLFTIENTSRNFFWITNYLETLLSAEVWPTITAATTAFEYRKILEQWAVKTGSPRDFVLWQGHDFSFRGMPGWEAAVATGVGHIASFFGTDTVPAIQAADYYYPGSDFIIAGSVPASEHSVMCAGGKEDEVETFRRMLNTYPEGIVSIVSDTWDFWNVVGGPDSIAAKLKQEILNRKPNVLGIGKTVFRPDSGDPADILCGDPTAQGVNEFAYKGAVECLWDTFGGTVNEAGFKVLNERVGLIYGDSITLARAKEIMQRLADKGFASCNVVFGIGSFTYQYVTRDTYGCAMKATYAVVNGEGRELFKDPVTDSGTKKSAKGLLKVLNVNGKYELFDQVTRQEEEFDNELTTLYSAGSFFKQMTFNEVRQNINEEIQKFI